MTNPAYVIMRISDFLRMFYNVNDGQNKENNVLESAGIVISCLIPSKGLVPWN